MSKKFLIWISLMIIYIILMTQNIVASVQRNDVAFPFELKNMEGQTVTLDSLKGMPTIFSFSATWCPPCNVEMQALKRIQDKYADKINVVIISSENPQTLKDFMQINEYGFTVLLDDGSLSEKYQVSGVPDCYVLDQQGVVYNHYEGCSSEEEEYAKLAKDIDALLAIKTEAVGDNRRLEGNSGNISSSDSPKSSESRDRPSKIGEADPKNPDLASLIKTSPASASPKASIAPTMARNDSANGKKKVKGLLYMLLMLLLSMLAGIFRSVKK